MRASWTVTFTLAAFAGCATTGKPIAKNEEEEEAGQPGKPQAATQQTAKKTEGKPEAPVPPAPAKQPEAPKVSASVKADYDAAVKKWEAAKAQKGGMTPSDCRSLADNFRSIRDPQLAAPAHFNAGSILDSCGREKEAEKEYEAALKANSGYGPAIANIGAIYYRQGNTSSARQYFERAIQSDPTRAGSAYANLGAILYEQAQKSGDRSLYTQAISNLRRALAIDAYDVPAYSILALVYYAKAETERSQLELASLVCRQAQEMEAGKNYPPIHNTLGLIWLKKRNPSLALKEFEQAVALDPKYVEAHLNIGAIGLSTRQYEKAAQAFASVLKLDPKNFDATIGMGVASRGLRKVDEAETWYKKAADLDSRNCAVQYNLGVLYQDYKTDPSNSNLNTAKDFLSKYRGCGNAEPRKVADAERRMKDIEEIFAALEEQKKMEAELKEQQAEMERQQKAAEAQQKAAQEKEKEKPADDKDAPKK